MYEHERSRNKGGLFEIYFKGHHSEWGQVAPTGDATFFSKSLETIAGRPAPMHSGSYIMKKCELTNLHMSI